jgi:hypothetical protein
MIQLKNCWTGSDEILYGRYASVVCPKIVFFFLFPTTGNTDMDQQTCEVGSTLAPLNYNDGDTIPENT